MKHSRPWAQPAVLLLGPLMLLPDIGRADPKPQHAELTALLHRLVIPQVPRHYENHSAWGGTIPIEPEKRLTRLRKQVQVGDRREWPHGTWRRTRLWLDDPARDVRLSVSEFSRTGPGKHRLRLEATVALHGVQERKEWHKGIQLLGVSVQADALVGLELTCDVALSVDAARFPPEVRVEPAVTDCRLELKQFEVVRVGRVLLRGDLPREIGNELKAVLQDLLRSREEQVKDLANQAIAQALREGKGNLSAAALLKAAPPKPKD